MTYILAHNLYVKNAVSLLQNGLGNVRLAMNGTPTSKKPFWLKPRTQDVHWSLTHNKQQLPYLILKAQLVSEFAWQMKN